MNQVLKDTVYGLGTQAQVDFIAKTGGMNEEEKQMFQLFHEQKSDSEIIDVMALNKRSFERIQDLVEMKVTLAVFYCINRTMEKQ